MRDLEHPGHPLGGVDALAARAKLQDLWRPARRPAPVGRRDTSGRGRSSPTRRRWPSFPGSSSMTRRILGRSAPAIRRRATTSSTGRRQGSAPRSPTHCDQPDAYRKTEVQFVVDSDFTELAAPRVAPHDVSTSVGGAYARRPPAGALGRGRLPVRRTGHGELEVTRRGGPRRVSPSPQVRYALARRLRPGTFTIADARRFGDRGSVTRASARDQ